MIDLEGQAELAGKVLPFADAVRVFRIPVAALGCCYPGGVVYGA